MYNVWFVRFSRVDVVVHCVLAAILRAAAHLFLQQRGASHDQAWGMIHNDNTLYFIDLFVVLTLTRIHSARSSLQSDIRHIMFITTTSVVEWFAHQLSRCRHVWDPRFDSRLAYCWKTNFFIFCLDICSNFVVTDFHNTC